MESSLEKAREAKRRRESGGDASSEVRTGDGEVPTSHDRGESSGLTQLLTMSEDAPDSDDEAADPTFDLDSSMRSDVDYMVETFCEEFVSHLDRDDKVSLGLFLCFQLSKQLELGETRSAELAALMIGKSDKVLR